MTAQTFTDTLVVDTCITCGVVFGVTTNFQQQRQQDHAIYCCPNGHKQHYSGQNTEERLRQRLKWAEESEQFYRDQATLERRRAAAQKGQRTRVMNLIAQGICPVGGCRRNFGNVRDHMATEHPDAQIPEATS